MFDNMCTWYLEVFLQVMEEYFQANQRGRNDTRSVKYSVQKGRRCNLIASIGSAIALFVICLHSATLSASPKSSSSSPHQYLALAFLLVSMACSSHFHLAQCRWEADGSDKRVLEAQRDERV